MALNKTITKEELTINKLYLLPIEDDWRMNIYKYDQDDSDE